MLALHVTRPITPAIDAAHAVAAVARGSTKPVLASWLGALDRQDVHDALEAGGIANFYTPENAVEALSFLAAYRRNQEWLLEVPPPQADPEPPDLATAERILAQVTPHGRHTLPLLDAQALLAAFGIALPPLAAVDTLAEAHAAARKLRYPVRLALDFDGPVLPASRGGIRSGRALARAYGELSHAIQRQAARKLERPRGGAARPDHLRRHTDGDLRFDRRGVRAGRRVRRQRDAWPSRIRRAP